MELTRWFETQRAALRAKYRWMWLYRRHGGALADDARKAALRRLAKAFPGALRELDELPDGELARRLDELQRPTSPRQELLAVALFHQGLRAPPSGPGRRPSRRVVAQLAARLGVSELEAHRLVFPYARVRRGLSAAPSGEAFSAAPVECAATPARAAQLSPPDDEPPDDEPPVEE